MSVVVVHPVQDPESRILVAQSDRVLRPRRADSGRMLGSPAGSAPYLRRADWASRQSSYYVLFPFVFPDGWQSTGETEMRYKIAILYAFTDPGALL